MKNLPLAEKKGLIESTNLWGLGEQVCWPKVRQIDNESYEQNLMTNKIIESA